MRKKSQELLAKQLRVQRLLAGITQAELAEKIGVSQRAVSYWEAGIMSPLDKHKCELFRIFPGLKEFGDE